MSLSQLWLILPFSGNSVLPFLSLTSMTLPNVPVPTVADLTFQCTRCLVFLVLNKYDPSKCPCPDCCWSYLSAHRVSRLSCPWPVWPFQMFLSQLLPIFQSRWRWCLDLLLDSLRIFLWRLRARIQSRASGSFPWLQMVTEMMRDGDRWYFI